MSCLFCCTASRYLLNDHSQYLTNNGFVVKHFDDGIFATMKKDENLAIFFFSFGCVTIWGGNNTQEQRILEELKEFEIEPLIKFGLTKLVLNTIYCIQIMMRAQHSLMKKEIELFLVISLNILSYRFLMLLRNR